jgi:hypothetical protein
VRPPMLRAPLNAPDEVWIPLAVWSGCAAAGVLMLVVGVLGARGSRDLMAASARLLLAAGCAALLWWQAYPADWGPVAAFLLKGLYIGWLAANLVRFLIAGGLGQGNARRAVTRSIKAKSAPLRAARPRSF